jgi:leader peptidase (prepilin peptidase) / N-methyltransferase
LIGLMLAASIIDVDEMMIPDGITVSGTILGLLAAAAWPRSLLPDVPFLPGGADMTGYLGFLQVASPNRWPATFGGAPLGGSLAIGLACWWLWCAAITTRTWYSRHGWRRAVQLSIARFLREPSTYRILRWAITGSLVIGIVWYRGGEGWAGLLSALVGMAVGGGLLWAVRIIGAIALQREAMGFGDVTLMAMIGAFLGWQSTLVVFFLAPVAGIVLGILRAILFRDREIPFGPFLCLASLAVIVAWDTLWQSVSVFFEMPGLVPLGMFGCLVLMGAMLTGWRLILHCFR